MDISAAVYDAANMFTAAMWLVNFVLANAAVTFLLWTVKSAIELFDYIRARRKISRGYGARRLAALAALESDGDKNE